MTVGSGHALIWDPFPPWDPGACLGPGGQTWAPGLSPAGSGFLLASARQNLILTTGCWEANILNLGSTLEPLDTGIHSTNRP